MGFGLLAGVLWALDTVVLSKALSFYEALLIAPLVAAFLHDTCSFVYLTFYHGWKKGIKKAVRVLRSKQGLWIVLASILGGPLGMSGYVSAIFFMGPSYTAAFSSLYPAFGALMAVVLFKEKLTRKQVFGMFVALGGVVALSMTPSDSIRNFPLGLGCALLCMVCWGLEGLLAQQGMKKETISSDQALWMRQGVSALGYGLVIMNLISGWELAETIVVQHHIGWIALAALSGTASYLCYYHALHQIGSTKAMPLNITYVAWSIGLSFLILGAVPSGREVLFALVVLCGAILSAS